LIPSRFGNRVTRQDIARLHRSLADTPRQANLVLAYCSKAFALAEEWGMRAEASNPCRRITRNPERHRERYLTNNRPLPDHFFGMGQVLGGWAFPENDESMLGV
jgi:hypothetical protein